jgi:glutamyl-tRNA(Gln) amidotransferase subunit D
MEEHIGYHGPSLNLLEKSRVSVGDIVNIKTPMMEYEGTVMPRSELADENHIVVKLKNGYNIGINIKKIQRIERISMGIKPHFEITSPSVTTKASQIVIISTGGTIASRVDYRTGAVHPALSAKEIYSVVPELSDHAQIKTEVLFSLLSENIESKHWKSLAISIAEKVRKGFQGVIVTHGTDTLGYTSAALSFALQNLPIPVVLVGSQRSSDRPSSDAAFNLLGAVKIACRNEFAGVYVVMHDNMSDDRLAVHLGTKVRKNHTSRRDAFESVNIPPIAYIEGKSIKIVNSKAIHKQRKTAFKLKLKPNFNPKVALLKFHPKFNSGIIDYLVEKNYKGIILEGTGLGHLGSSCHASINNATRKALVAMTSQCIWGRVRMTVYDTGRDLLSMGVLPLEDMLPETALVKMMWVLGNVKDLEKAKELMVTNIANEINPRSSLEKKPKG